MSDNFQVLTDAQHLIIRPSMYIGSTSIEETQGMFFGKYQTLKVVPGLIKIIMEILDNSIDEAIRTNFEFANKISVEVAEADTLEGTEWKVSVTDNGRGIPVTLVPGTKIYRPVASWTQARAGSNFDDKRNTLGANGVGSFATAVFSTEFIGETSDGKNFLKLTCGPQCTVKDVTVKPSTKQYTKVSFKPDLSKFESGLSFDSHLLFIQDRLENLAAVFPDIQFSFNGEKIKIKNMREYALKYVDHPIIAQDESNNCLIFGPSGKDEELRVHSYVNGLWARNGGTHVTYVLDQLLSSLREGIKKKHKIEVLPNQIKQHLTCVSILRGFIDLKFDSQTKERITNSVSEVSEHLKEFNFDKISKQILNCPEIIDPMIASILYKKQLAEQLEAKRKQKAVAKTRVVNHITASSKDPEKKMLFLAEGLSAIGTLLQVRDPQIHGGFPLRGKVLNTRGMKPVEILANKEVSQLLSIIGLEFGKPATDLNYGKIVLMTDQDQDGSSIMALLLNMFSHWPELFHEGRLYRLMTPLYSAQKGSDVKMYYTKQEYEAAGTLKGYEISYNKGLGTLSKDVYSKCINDPFLIKITNYDPEVLEMAFGDNAQLRKDWMLA